MAALPLRETQKLFIGSLVDRTKTQNLSAIIDDSYGAGCDQRIAVYTNAYFLRLQEVLSEDFPRTLRLLGSDAFASLAREYIAQNPSRNPSVIRFGGKFVQFLEQTRQKAPWLAELARLEWSRIEAFVAPASPILTLGELAKVPPAQWAEISFAAAPSLRCLECRWPVQRLWAGESAANVEAQSTSLRVWRDANYQVLHAKMDDREAAALRAMIDGNPFAAVLEKFGDTPLAPAEAASLLGRWLADGLIGAVRFPLQWSSIP